MIKIVNCIKYKISISLFNLLIYFRRFILIPHQNLVKYYQFYRTICIDFVITKFKIAHAFA